MSPGPPGVPQRLGSLRVHLRLLHLSALQIATRFYWLVPFLPLLWLGVLALLLLTPGAQAYTERAAQNFLIGLPMTVLAIFLGLRIIAGEIDRRSLEIAYTVPGGSHRMWLAKLTASTLILIASELLLAPTVFVFFTPFPLGSLYGALQAAIFYLVLAMALGALARSEVVGAMLTVAVLALNIVLFFDRVRFSPLWNPLAVSATDPSEVLARALQNRIGFVLATGAIVALAFVRAERRERMLGG